MDKYGSAKLAGGCYTENAVMEKRQAAVVAEVESLGYAINRVDTSLDGLVTRLSPVLRIETATNNANHLPLPPYGVPLADELQALKNRLKQMEDTLDSIHSRLEL